MVSLRLRLAADSESELTVTLVSVTPLPARTPSRMLISQADSEPAGGVLVGLPRAGRLSESRRGRAAAPPGPAAESPFFSRSTAPGSSSSLQRSFKFSQAL